MRTFEILLKKLFLIGVVFLFSLSAAFIYLSMPESYDSFAEDEQSAPEMTSVYVISKQYVKFSESKKKYRDRTYHYYSNGMIKSINDRGLFDEFGMPTNTYYRYDDNNSLIGAIVFSERSRMFDEMVEGLCACEYDETGNMVMEHWIFPEDDEFTICGDSKYTYNDKGQIIRERGWSYIYNEIYNIDIIDEVAEAGAFDMDRYKQIIDYYAENGGTINDKRKWCDINLSYNTRGLVKMDTGKMYGKKVTIKRKYDKNNNISSIKSNRSDYSYKKITNKYNKKGLLTKKTFKFGKLSDTYYYKYKKITIPTEMLQDVLSQRWALQNNNLNHKLVFYEDDYLD